MLKQTKRLTRPYTRKLQSSYRAMRKSIADNSPPWLNRRLNSAFERFDLFFVDHGIFRVVYPNRHLLTRQAWRSSQPAPHDIRYLSSRGLRTIINLRGDRNCGSYRLERKACRRYGVEMIDFSVKSREAPQREIFHEAKALFDNIKYPMMLHCKSGADRAGLMSVLFMIFKEGKPVSEAKRQLSLRFGHIKQADTGVLDFVFDVYLAHNAREPIAFLDWVDRYYDPAEIRQHFRAAGAANVLVNTIIKRE